METKKHPVARGPCHLTSIPRGLPHFICELNTRKKYASFVPIIHQSFFEKECHITFQELITMASGKILN